MRNNYKSTDNIMVNIHHVPWPTVIRGWRPVFSPAKVPPTLNTEVSEQFTEDGSSPQLSLARATSIA
ncbi:hypothetical protein Hypma_006847 [Hypsizygus marmoreus]|uniref:Uncharacterized protein n=1 Tax=Hypsizygus marmoreus TaxID=39966 RepID=A0A369JYS7_HYPMA|nr:hypothetical protein Hypma_006847 [Hypsizygus marmoreus]